MKTKNLLLIMALIIMSFMLVGCNGIQVIDNEVNDNVVSGDVEVVEDNKKEENDGIIKIELYPQIAPESVENFIALANSGFYNGLTFHRTIPSFMSQGGDPEGNGTGGPGYAIYGEFSQNGFENSLKHERGVISMARSEDMNSAGSQFFIMDEYAESLDGLYAAFGKVIDGMDVVDAIVDTEVIRRDIDMDITTLEEYYRQYMEIDRPVNPPKIKSITVETFGVNYEEPLKITQENSGDIDTTIANKDAKRYANVEQNPIVTIEMEK